ncbi:hypothetical protein P280DRAFT_389357 [Massarina eburnea CBS 473.64]|uniref:N-acetyltransferase domain-containing protein n=1 Tax=Massarina eburnea CBS 473.64 TaxID=1395130 RepID=A0A6A6SF21_9PLEO|nr:hypothetical protein P280DRAFT_389357 [Massarina eburnea CBS 473.64]
MSTVLTGLIELSQLYVDPDYQRQGIGQRLLEWGLKQADEDGYPVYLEGTTSAKPFYEKAGFATKAEPVFPGVVGADGAEYKQYFMLRPVA